MKDLEQTYNGLDSYFEYAKTQMAAYAEEHDRLMKTHLHYMDQQYTPSAIVPLQEAMVLEEVIKELGNQVVAEQHDWVYDRPSVLVTGLLTAMGNAVRDSRYTDDMRRKATGIYTKLITHISRCLDK